MQHEINCKQCIDEDGNPLDRDCRRCFFSQIPAVHDPFYKDAVRPYCWFAAVLLFLSYVIGLLFTLRTHAATIWNSEIEEKKIEKMDQSITRLAPSATPNRPAGVEQGIAAVHFQHPPTASISSQKSDIKESLLYRRILSQSLKQSGVASALDDNAENRPPQNQGMDGQISTANKSTPETDDSKISIQVPGLSSDESKALIRQMAEMAATAAAVATRDATQNPRKASTMAKTPTQQPQERPAPPAHRLSAYPSAIEEPSTANETPGGGHDAPNWGRVKSCTVLLTATIAYAVIAEILVNTVDSVLQHVDIDEKFLGITLFALVPNTTEFLNAISFAMNGNIALSMEIGSAYALQVCLLQIPALVLFSGIHGRFIDPEDIIDHTFSLIFPQWDMVTVILCVFLLSYMYGEGKSNYFKGSILILSYLVVIVGFYLTGFDNMALDDGFPPTGSDVDVDVMLMRGMGRQTILRR